MELLKLRRFFCGSVYMQKIIDLCQPACFAQTDLDRNIIVVVDIEILTLYKTITTFDAPEDKSF